MDKPGPSSASASSVTAEALENVPVVNKKKEDKLRRRDCKSLENVLKEINALPEEERLKQLTTRYGQLYDVFRMNQCGLQTVDKRFSILQREKDQMQSEHNRLMLAKSRLESLCRELQRQNKLIKDESAAKVREEEERRKEVAAKFQATLTEVTTMMSENSEKNVKLKNDNIEMASKIDVLCKQFEQRKDRLAQMEKEMEVERQFATDTITKAEAELKNERNVWARERDLLLRNLNKSETTCKKLQSKIKALEDSLEVYTNQYKQFEQSVGQSNAMFDNFKTDMTKLTKQIAILEKEANSWKQRWQKNAQSVLELSAVKVTQDAKLEIADKRLNQLQKLCRQLQVDRANYLKLLKQHGIDSSLQASSTVTEQPSIKELQLQQLKLSLKLLQEELGQLQGGKNDEPHDGKSEIVEDSQSDALKLANELAELQEAPEGILQLDGQVTAVPENVIENLKEIQLAMKELDKLESDPDDHNTESVSKSDPEDHNNVVSKCDPEDNNIKSASKCDPKDHNELASKCDPEDHNELASKCDPEDNNVESASKCDPEDHNEIASKCDPEDYNNELASKCDPKDFNIELASKCDPEDFNIDLASGFDPSKYYEYGDEAEDPEALAQEFAADLENVIWKLHGVSEELGKLPRRKLTIKRPEDADDLPTEQLADLPTEQLSETDEAAIAESVEQLYCGETVNNRGLQNMLEPKNPFDFRND